MNNDLKIKEGLILDGVINKFEKQSLIVKTMIDIKLLISKMVLITAIYGVGYVLLNKFILIKNIYSIVGITAILIFLFIKIDKIFSGNTPKKYLDKKERFKVLKNVSNNLKYMRNNEIKLLKDILIINKIYKVSIIDELINYYSTNLNKENLEFNKIIKEMFGLFLTIIFGIIGVYTSIKWNLNSDEMFNSILSITLKGIIIYALILIVYVIYKLRNFSISYFYVYHRVYKLLIEIKINKLLKYDNIKGKKTQRKITKNKRK